MEKRVDLNRKIEVTNQKLRQLKAWKAEYAELIAERKTLNQRYLALKDKMKEAEQIHKSVYNILWQEQRERESRRTQNMKH